jgi:hypothetical protein
MNESISDGNTVYEIILCVFVCVCVCVCVDIPIMLTSGKFDRVLEILFDCISTGGMTKHLHHNFLQSVIRTWRVRKIVKWEQSFVQGLAMSNKIFKNM